LAGLSVVSAVWIGDGIVKVAVGQRGTLVLASIAAGAVGVVLLPLMCMRSFGRAYLKLRFVQWAGRLKRLERIGAHPQGFERLPHRAFERAWLRKGPRGLRESMKFMPAAHLIVLEGPFPVESPWPVRTHIRFQPIELSGDSEGIHGLIQANLTAQGMPPEGLDQACGPRSGHTMGSFVTPPRIVSPRFVALFVLFGFSVAYVTAYLGWLALPIGPILLLALVYCLGGGLDPLLATTRGRWWLIPGGLVRGRCRPWQREVRVRVFRRKETSIVARPSLGAFVHNRGEVNHLPLTPHRAWALAAAWLSTAPEPAEAEILAFFGPNAVMERMKEHVSE
jgi:hypothetical protein